MRRMVVEIRGRGIKNKSGIVVNGSIITINKIIARVCIKWWMISKKAQYEEYRPKTGPITLRGASGAAGRREGCKYRISVGFNGCIHMKLKHVAFKIVTNDTAAANKTKIYVLGNRSDPFW